MPTLQIYNAQANCWCHANTPVRQPLLHKGPWREEGLNRLLPLNRLNRLTSIYRASL